MFTLIKSLCVMLCFVTGVYSFAIFAYHKKMRGVYICFGALCIVMSFFASYRLGFKSVAELYTVSSGFIPASFLSTLSLVSLFTYIYSMYSCLTLEKFTSKRTIHFVNCFVCVIFAILPFFAPNGWFVRVYILVNILFAISCTYAGYHFYRLCIDKSKIYFLAVIGYLGMFISTLITMVLVIVKVNGYKSPLAIIMPISLTLQTIMITLLYDASRKHTRLLAESLVNTIDRITHSDNALMCTQMKADFLYDTLDLIRSRCNTDPDTAEYLTVSLSKYLRHTLNFQQLKGIVPLENEIELIRAYAVIEKEKHPGISFEYNLPDEIPNIFIPPLSIQPLVENAIEHGICKKDGSGTVKITVMPYKDYYQIDVSDTGIGIPEDELKKLPDSFMNTARIGLYNIHTRLLALFEKGLVVQSAPGFGTSVSFVVPPDVEKKFEEAGGDRND